MQGRGERFRFFALKGQDSLAQGKARGTRDAALGGRR